MAPWDAQVLSTNRMQHFWIWKWVTLFQGCLSHHIGIFKCSTTPSEVGVLTPPKGPRCTWTPQYQTGAKLRCWGEGPTCRVLWASLCWFCQHWAVQLSVSTWINVHFFLQILVSGLCYAANQEHRLSYGLCLGPSPLPLLPQALNILLMELEGELLKQG